MDSPTETSSWRTSKTLLDVSFETCLRRREDVLMRRCLYILLRCPHNVPMRCRWDLPLRRLNDVPLTRHWVFHLRRNCDVAGTYKETSLRRRRDVLLPGGLLQTCGSNLHLTSSKYQLWQSIHSSDKRVLLVLIPLETSIFSYCSIFIIYRNSRLNRVVDKVYHLLQKHT